jgi:D-amino-acid dehydrogenase
MSPREPPLVKRTSPSAHPPIVVIGAGIIGACVSACLQRDGHEVVLIDHDDPGSGASSGNGGVLSASSIIPVAMPGTAARVPGWLMDPEGPLTIRWGYLPALIPWLWRFIRSATPGKVEAQAKALRTLLEASLENYAPLVRDAGAQNLIHQRGTLYLYASEQSWRSDARNTDLRRRNGVAMEDIIGPALHELEPDLGPGFSHARLVRGNGHTSDPRALVQKLVAHALSRGARLERERVVGFEHNGAQVTAVATERGRHAASRVVLACGAFSRPLARQLGDALPLDTERGYHIIVKDPEQGPRTPTLFVDGSFSATPMDMGLRFTGTVELAGLDAPPNWRRAEVLLRGGRRLYPGLLPEGGENRVTRWMGFRPSMPDSLPVIGPSSRFANAFYAFGHGHVGMCAGSTTGRLIADLVAGREPCVPVGAFSARRFD